MTRQVVLEKEAKQVINSFIKKPDFRVEYDAIERLLEKNLKHVVNKSRLIRCKNKNGDTIEAYLYSQAGKFVLWHDIRVVFHYDEDTVYILGFDYDKSKRD